jgi:hypothetical protein
MSSTGRLSEETTEQAHDLPPVPRSAPPEIPILETGRATTASIRNGIVHIRLNPMGPPLVIMKAITLSVVDNEATLRHLKVIQSQIGPGQTIILDPPTQPRTCWNLTSGIVKSTTWDQREGRPR